MLGLGSLVDYKRIVIEGLMSIWGKLIGGVAGYAIGGPLGGIIGAVAGHHFDKVRAAEKGEGPSTFTGHGPDSRQIAFTTAIIVLAAKMAKSDGKVTADEIATFKRLFQIPNDEQQAVAQIWSEAKRDASGFEPYAKQIADLFSQETQVLEELLGALFHIAKADGVMHTDELRMLASIGQIFGFEASAFERIKGIHLGSDQAKNPYEVLELERSAGDIDVKRKYRELMRENHPDVLMAKGVPEEFIEIANEKVAAINSAYDQITKERGIK